MPRRVWLAAFAALLWAAPTSGQTLPAILDAEALLADIIADPRFLPPADTGEPQAIRFTYPATPKGLRVADHRDESEVSDPYEGINRLAHGFNALVRRHLLEPIALEWLDVSDRATQQGVSNVFANLREPITIVNSLLLGDLDGAGNATYRFALNSTAGVGGYYDVATELGVERRPRTLEEVLCIYGVPAGPYTVIPILGPGTVRDAAGRVTTLLASYFVLGPVYIPYRISDIVIQYVGVREQLKFIDSISVDPYTAQKSATLQARRTTCEGQTAALIKLFGQQ